MKIRDAFEEKPGNIKVEADFNQMEVGCLGAASRDPILIKEVRRGDDLHSKNAAAWKKRPVAEVLEAVRLKEQGSKDPEVIKLVGWRKTAKIMTFQLAYGASAQRLANDFGITIKDAQAFIDSFCDKYKGVDQWWASTVEWVNAHLQTVPLYMQEEPEYVATLVYPHGKRYAFVARDTKRMKYGPDRGKTIKRVGDRFIKNYPIQGIASDLLKLAQASLWRQRRQLATRGVVPVIQIHDALYFRMREEVFSPKFVAFLDHHMTKVPVRVLNQLAGYDWWPEDLPLRIDLKTGRKWSEMSEYVRT